MATLLATILASGLGCAQRAVPRADHGPWRTWQNERLASVAGPNGWASLAGLYWLTEGTNTLGSDPANTLVLPAGRAPATAGLLVRAGRSGRFIADPGVGASVDGAAVSDIPLRSDANNRPPSVLSLGDLSLTILQRGERMGLRVRDPKAPTRVHFQGLDYFQYDLKWRVEGRFEPAEPGRSLAIQDVTGVMNQEPSPGTLVFRVDGVEHRLEVLEDLEAQDFFVLFRDATAGKTTYGSGRFLHVAKPEADGRVVLDFNYAYNPPCAFTPFATCPIPPRQNWLPLAIKAGEKAYRGGPKH